MHVLAPAVLKELAELDLSGFEHVVPLVGDGIGVALDVHVTHEDHVLPVRVAGTEGSFHELDDLVQLLAALAAVLAVVAIVRGLGVREQEGGRLGGRIDPHHADRLMRTSVRQRGSGVRGEEEVAAGKQRRHGRQGQELETAEEHEAAVLPDAAVVHLLDDVRPDSRQVLSESLDL